MAFDDFLSLSELKSLTPDWCERHEPGMVLRDKETGDYVETISFVYLDERNHIRVDVECLFSGKSYSTAVSWLEEINSLELLGDQAQ